MDTVFTMGFQLTLGGYSIEANFVLIGACIPTLYPLLTKIFGAAVLGSAASRSGTKSGRPTIQTIGSFKSRKKRSGLTTLDHLETRVVDYGNVQMMEREGSGNSGGTTLRNEDGHVPIAQP